MRIKHICFIYLIFVLSLIPSSMYAENKFEYFPSIVFEGGYKKLLLGPQIEVSTKNHLSVSFMFPGFMHISYDFNDNNIYSESEKFWLTNVYAGVHYYLYKNMVGPYIGTHFAFAMKNIDRDIGDSSMGASLLFGSKILLPDNLVFDLGLIFPVELEFPFNYPISPFPIGGLHFAMGMLF